MANKIKGITIEIGGDTVGLEKALTNVNKQSNSLKSELRDVERLLKFNPGNAEALAQKQKLLADQINVTADRLNYLKQAEQQVQQQFEKGSISEEQYRKFRREIEFTEGSLGKLKDSLSKINSGAPLKDLSKDAKEAEKSVSGLGGEIAGLAAGLAAGGGLAGTISTALDMSSLDTKIDIQFDVPEESKQAVKNAVKGIQAYGVDAEAALEGVRRQWALNKDASDATNDTVVRGAGAISAAFSGVDFAELIQETNEIAAGIDISNENALALVDSLLKAGFPPEQLDTIAEYGQQMKDAGFNAAEIQSIFEAGIDTKTWNIDNLNDGVKEARIQMTTFGLEIPKAMKPLLKDAGVSAKQFQDWGKAVAAGGEEGSKAMSEMVTWLEGIEDKTLKNEIATKVFGTKWEDQGQNMISVFQGLSDTVDKTTENTNGLYETMGTINADPAVQLEQAFNRLKEVLQPLLSQIAEFVTNIANWVAENPKLAATITVITTGLGILVGICMALVPIILTITTSATALGVSMSAVLLPVIAIVAGIAALIAIGVLLYKNWDEIKAKSIEIWGAIKEFLSATWESIKSVSESVWTSIKDFFSTTWDTVKQTAQTIWDNIKQAAINIWTAIIDGIMNVVTPIIEGVTGLFNSMKSGVEKIFQGIKTFFEGYWKVLKNIFAGALLLIVDLVTGDFEGLKKDALAIWENIKSGLKTMWEGIKTVFSGALEAVKGFVTQAWENIKNNTSTIFYAVRDKISEVWNSIKTTATNLPEQIKNTVRDKFEALKSAISEKMTAARDKITEIWDSITSFFNGIDLKQIGKDIIQGLINGITEKGEALLQKARDIADSIKKTLKDVLDINSPSRETQWMGQMLGDGFVKGMDQSLSKINNMAKEMSLAALPDINAQNSQMNIPQRATSPSVTQNITINSPSPISPSETARQNRLVLQQFALGMR
jgi:phage-related minor tail protein